MRTVITVVGLLSSVRENERNITVQTGCVVVPPLETYHQSDAPSKSIEPPLPVLCHRHLHHKEDDVHTIILLPEFPTECCVSTENGEGSGILKLLTFVVVFLLEFSQAS